MNSMREIKVGDTVRIDYDCPRKGQQSRVREITPEGYWKLENGQSFAERSSLTVIDGGNSWWYLTSGLTAQRMGIAQEQMKYRAMTTSSGYTWSGYRDSGLQESKPNMKLTTMFKLLVDADTATLKKAGFINGDLELTGEGSNELMAIVFNANKAALVASAKAKLDEEAKK